MIQLFPKARSLFLGGLTLAFLVGAAVWHEGGLWYFALGATLLIAALAYVAASVQAVRMHGQILAYLYALLKPRDFIEGYVLLMKGAKLRPHVRFSMLSNLVNGYTAAGDYRMAAAVLEEMEGLSVSTRRKPQAMLTGARCNLCCAEGKLAPAREEYAKLKTFPRDTVPAEVLEQYRVKLALLDGTVTDRDAAFIRETMKQGKSALFRADMKFLLGQIYHELGEQDFALAYLGEAASCGDQMAIASRAAALLKQEQE